MRNENLNFNVDIFDRIFLQFGSNPFTAEDSGFNTDQLENLVKKNFLIKEGLYFRIKEASKLSKNQELLLNFIQTKCTPTAFSYSDILDKWLVENPLRENTYNGQREVRKFISRILSELNSLGYLRRIVRMGKSSIYELNPKSNND